MTSNPKITVIGTGYLGATHAASMAELGFDVLGVDIDPTKIEKLSQGVLPFHEPGLPELLLKHSASGRLRFTTSLEEAAEFGDVHFIAVGTPQKEGDNAADMTYVYEAVTSIARLTKKDCLIAGKSTVPVGTSREILRRIAGAKQSDVDIQLAWNPEFLREGFAVKDTLEPDRLIVGAEDERAVFTLKTVYADALSRDTPFIESDFETAELTKVAANAFLATKISFINAFSEVTERVGGDIRVLADAIGYDARIGRRFLNAGVGFGGGCLPKDIRALQARTSELGLDRTMSFLHEVDQINLRRRDRVVDLTKAVLKNVVNKKVAVLGTTFKPNSDDVRDSPALDVAAQLYGAGADVHVYDPQGMENSAARFPRLTYSESVEEALRDAEIVLLLTEWQEFQDLDPRYASTLVSGRIIIDGRNVLDPGAWQNAGWEFFALGRRTDKFLANK